MLVGFIISLSLLGIIAVFVVVALFADIKFNFKQFKLLILALIVLLTAMTYFFVPNDFIGWDLLSHYRLIDNMREFGWTYAINTSGYKDLYVINTFMYLVSLLPNNALFQTVPMLIDLCIFGYILLDQMKEKYNDNDAVDMKVTAIILIAFFGAVSLKLAISGVRNVLAASIVSLAVYLEFIKKKKFILSILLYVTAIFIHQYALLYIVMRALVFVFSFKPIRKFMPMLVFTYPLAHIAFKLGAKFGSGFILSQSQRMLDYLGLFDFDKAMLYPRYTVMVFLTWIAIFFCLYFLINKDKTKLFTPKNIGLLAFKKEESRIYLYMSVIIFMGVGLSLNYLLMERYMYFLSFALVMFLPQYYFTHTVNNLSSHTLLLLSGYSFLYDFETIIVNYTGYWR